jgi:hypothetical protein
MNLRRRFGAGSKRAAHGPKRVERTPVKQGVSLLTLLAGAGHG